MILAVGAVMVLGYFLLVNNQFGYYRSPDYQMAEQWVKRYGPTMEEDERRDAEKDVLAVEREMDEWLANQPEFAAAGIFDHHDWDDYRNRTGKFENLSEDWEDWEETDEILYDLLFGYDYETNSWKSDDLGMRYQDIPGMLESYDTRNELFDLDDPDYGYSQSQIANLEWQNQLKKADGLRGLLPRDAFYNLYYPVIYFALLAVLGVFLLLSPYPVRDRLRDVRPLQWTSKTGRKLARVQFGAMMVSAFLLTTAVLVPCFLKYLSTGDAVFFDCPVNGFMSGVELSWNLTLGQWVMVCFIFCYIAALGAASFAYLLARSCSGYVSMLLKEVLLFAPLIVAVFYLSTGGGIIRSNQTLYPLGTLDYATGIPGAGFLTVCLILAAGIAACLFAAHRQRRKELV